MRGTLAAIAMLALTACGGGGDAADGGAGSDVVSCAGDPRVDAYTPGLTRRSASGAYQVVLRAADPAPPAIGTNQWTIEVDDGAGAPMPAAELKVVPFMPDHGHGTSVRAQVSPGTGGTFSVSPLYLFMGGVWRVEFNPRDGAADPVDFFFCVGG